MDTPKKPDQPCPGPTKTARSRVEALRQKRERLRDALRISSAQLAEAEAKAERLARIATRQRGRLEQGQLATLCQAVGLDRYRLKHDANNPDSPIPLDAELIGGALIWLRKRMDAMSPEDLDLMREEGAALIKKEMQEKRNARVKKDAPMKESPKGAIDHPSAFEIRE